MICKEESIDCYFRKCLRCNMNEPSDFFIKNLNIIDIINENDHVTWTIWERNEKRTELQRHTTSISTLLEKLDCLWVKFLSHHYFPIEQREYIKKIKLDSSENGTAVIQLDFA